MHACGWSPVLTLSLSRSITLASGLTLSSLHLSHAMPSMRERAAMPVVTVGAMPSKHPGLRRLRQQQ